MIMKTLGTHLLIELWSCNCEKMDNLEYLENIMAHAAEVAGATVLKTAFQNYNPHGVSGVVVIAESHLTIHTWPEHGYAAVDVFTCGETVDPWKAAGFLKQELEAGEFQVKDFKRGVPPQGVAYNESLDNPQTVACGSVNS
jgi:S-adenosylmethionine decarboxylase proenzyme